MEPQFSNCYADERYAAAYARLEFPGTYFLAFRDLPDLLARHVRGTRALDFGCGTGRSTRFLARLGLQTTGVDISPEMIRHAQSFDPLGDYRLVTEDGPRQFADGAFDLVLAAFPFDNIPTRERKVQLFAELRRLLAPDGRIVSVVSTPDIYRHEWLSFTTRDFPENGRARCGDEVRIINLALNDPRPAVDILWPDEDYRDVYARSGLRVVEWRLPLGRDDEGFEWVTERTIAPWAVYVLGR
ncbi:MAG: methyltransferase domain-containing protein [Phycisphaerae bacterium]